MRKSTRGRWSGLKDIECTVNTVQCRSCEHVGKNPMVCVVHPSGKPIGVLKCQTECDGFVIKNNTVLDGIVGLCVGDALGVPVEFVSREQLDKTPVTLMQGFGTHNQPPGTWSDDTSLTLCLASALTEEPFTEERLAEKMIMWYRDGDYTATGQVFDIGIATQKSIERLIKGIPPMQAGGIGERDNGNGGLMRILPLAYALENEKNLAVRAQMVYQVTAVTHGHARSKIASHLYVELAIRLLKSKDRERAYQETIQEIKGYYEDKVSVSEWVHFDRIFSGTLGRLPRDQIMSSGYVIHTLEAAIWCMLNYNTYEETVLAAVNLGEDTDTTAAVVGGLAGIVYGIDSIPKEWLRLIINKTFVFNLSTALWHKLQHR